MTSSSSGTPCAPSPGSLLAGSAKVAAQSNYAVDWRFISLRLLNKDKDYATEFPPEYEHGHTAGLRMLRVAAAVRHEQGRDPLGATGSSLRRELLGQAQGLGHAHPPQHHRTRRRGADALPGSIDHYAEALDDTRWDALLDDETELALGRTGRDVGTPIITFQPPDGLSFFGPVISRVPSDEEAVPLWNAVTTLAAFPGFAEMKRSLREVPQLNILGGTSKTPTSEDWTGGHRAGHLASDRTQTEE